MHSDGVESAEVAVVAADESPERPKVMSKPDKRPAVSAASPPNTHTLLWWDSGMQQTECCLSGVSTMLCARMLVHFIVSAASEVHSHCCDETCATARHPCGCGGIACEKAKGVESGCAHRVAWRLPACQLALRVSDACPQARHAGDCKAKGVACQGPMQPPEKSNCISMHLSSTS